MKDSKKEERIKKANAEDSKKEERIKKANAEWIARDKPKRLSNKKNAWKNWATLSPTKL